MIRSLRISLLSDLFAVTHFHLVDEPVRTPTDEGGQEETGKGRIGFSKSSSAVW